MRVDMSVCLGHPQFPEASTGEMLLKALDSAGVEKAVVFSYAPSATYDFASGNREVAALVKRYPDRFVGFGVFNPFKDLEEIDRLAADYGFRGLMFLTSWGEWAYGLQHFERYVIPIAQRAAELGLVFSIEHEQRVPVHTHVAHDAFIAEAVPGLKIVLSRCWTWHLWRDYIAIAEMYPQFMLEFGLCPTSLLQQATKKLGPQRLMVGSWAPELDPRIPKDLTQYLDIDESAREKMTGGNAASLLGL